MDVFFVILLLITELALLGISWYWTNGDIISPSAVTLALFIISTACFLYDAKYWDVVFSFKAYMLFSMSFLLMVLTERFISKHRISFHKITNRYATNSTNKYILSIRKPFSILLLMLFTACSLLYVYRVYKSGMAHGALSLLTSIGVNKEIADFDGFARLLYNLTRFAGYVYTMIFANNVFGCKQRIRKNLSCLWIIILSLIITFFSGQRSSIICFIFSIIVATCIALYDSQRIGKKVDTKKLVRKLLIVGVIILAGFYLSANIVKGTNIQRDPVYYLTYYFGSTTALMGKIVSDPSICHQPFVGYFGEKTFMGFWNTMNSWGIVSQPPADRLWIRMGGTATNAGNEYTFFCGPYIDFGFIGTLVFIITFYAIFAYIYYWKIRKAPVNKKRYTTISIYLFLYTLISMSFYQDTIRSYSRPINILYIIYLVVFCKMFLRIKEKEQSNWKTIRQI